MLLWLDVRCAVISCAVLWHVVRCCPCMDDAGVLLILPSLMNPLLPFPPPVWQPVGPNATATTAGVHEANKIFDELHASKNLTLLNTGV